MASIKAVPTVWAIRTYLFLVVFSVAGHLFSSYLRLNPGFIAPISGFLTLVSGLLAAFSDFWGAGRVTALFSSLIIFFLGLSVELLGLGTGFPFGRYHYTGLWWPFVSLPAVGIFPLLLPLAWMMSTGAAAFACRVTSSSVGNALLAACATTGLDLVMEGALAGRQGYWVWDVRGPLPGGSPWSNSVSWFILSFLAALILYRAGKPQRMGGIAVLGGQLLLMVALWVT